MTENRANNSAPVTAPHHSVEGFVKEFLRELHYGQGVTMERASVNDQYLALARTVREYLMARWLETVRRQRDAQAKSVAYLSAEYLLGRQLDNALLATDMAEIVEEGLASLGIELATLRDQEVEPGLGNGGLGRLAACFVDSLATMSVPCIGYGIRYEYGIFRQTFVDGFQVEKADSWLTLGAPWEFPHPESAVTVHFGGSTERYTDDDGVERSRWVPAWDVLGVPYNYMVPGYQNGRVNTLRLWSAQATEAFDLAIFNSGEYVDAVRSQTFAENISKVLYPEDSTPQGKELRLQQQYFFVACSIRDFIENVLPDDFDLHRLPERIIFQLNDTHPVIAVPELMRILVDEKKWDWDEAWAVTQKCFAYTCHTLLPEALEVWPVALLGKLLPRHLEIIYRINDDFLAEVAQRYPGDELRLRRMSIIAEHPERSVRMAYLATIAGSKVNGVAALHSQLLRDKVLPDFSEYWPDKFTNVTNGVTPRRFVRLANPALSELITDAIGPGWITDLARLREMEPLADDQEFREKFRAVKAHNKQRLSVLLQRRDGITLPADAMLDVMVKRLHEYKRQTLKVLHIVSLYEQIISGELDPTSIPPRVFAFGAKAAPGYKMAKQTIALINHVGRTVNEDPRVKGALTVVFPPNYNVTLAETLIPAADLSEQISLAGKEASGTGNMKFALNGALTIGTDDGANVEIRELVGDENFFLFGLLEPEVEELVTAGYQPSKFYEENPTLRRAIDRIASGTFAGGDRTVFEPIVSNLLYEDRFLVLADFQSYLDAQARVDAAYQDTEAWTRSAILNVARSGYFSSDRAMWDYIDRIWHSQPLVAR
ncbi:glycogen/starch/alpha-glucan phosphorylase [Cellulomonas xiejunii]|uniref:Alpha-1,4 glucan phosphorylase n=1 Tax=Cellulomonas xiejunii TaxID=2968083 RepID=A0ABY5KVU7_9CELL|nr:glycogen/starch/alpha-glucan phosphorylase [Cellulomonas xiejunii]MCC2313947.1 glycogen/starch/alpha-glucan phosphorylase [Cellulomonas xiejunii]MCC2322409.1 glycogen/starch/alpha-glucan phosphorylase [Cellulomonas xiejunii]UUI72458.1 glycogen/starch/alpha-glucan phosphorylase [Cellulomonas xiejunii]